MPGVHRIIFVILATCIAAGTRGLPAQETENKNKPDRWTYSAEQLKPFWKADVIHDEPVLFVKDPNTGAAIADLLFPVKEVLSVRNSTGDINYKADVDYQVKPGASQIVVPSNSGIVTYLPKQLRRPAGSQKYNLTHRDGNGEILFGATLEYHGMQTLVT